MTISSSVKLVSGTLSVRRMVLSSVLDVVVASSAAVGGAVEGIFLSADFTQPAARHVVSLGALRLDPEPWNSMKKKRFFSPIHWSVLLIGIDLIWRFRRGVRFMACFRFKLWWMAQRMGEKGGDVPLETQFLLVESRGAGAGGEDGEAAYVVFLPLVEGAFRASLQGGAGDALELCVESGDADTRAASFDRALFVGAAESDPFAAIAVAVAAAKSALKTFRVRAEKKLPGIVDYEWCTWDAFYQDVT